MLRTRAIPTAPEGIGGEPDPPPPHPAIAMPMNNGASTERFANLTIVNKLGICTVTSAGKARAFARIHIRQGILAGISLF
jgi:hypothetical protein